MMNATPATAPRVAPTVAPVDSPLSFPVFGLEVGVVAVDDAAFDVVAAGGAEDVGDAEVVGDEALEADDSAALDMDVEDMLVVRDRVLVVAWA